MQRNLSRLVPSLVLVTLSLACSGPESQDAHEQVPPPTVAPAEEAVSRDSESTVSQFGTIFQACGSNPICPPGSLPINGPLLCSSSCYPYNGQCPSYAWYNSIWCEVTANGSISADPTDVWINTNVTSVGSTQLCWDVNYASNGEVWLSMDGQPEVLFARMPDGCQSADWIQVGHTYSFTLYEGTAHSNPLASVNVTGYGYQGLR